MDPQTMVIGAAIFVVSAIVIYLISVCSMREKTFEEVLEEQRQMQAEEQKKLKLEKKEKIRKRYGGKKVKKVEKTDERGQQPVSSGSDTDNIPEPEIEPAVVKPVQSARPEKKKKLVKSREEPAVRQEKLYEPLVKEQVGVKPPLTHSLKEQVGVKPPLTHSLKEQVVEAKPLKRVEAVQVQAEPPRKEHVHKEKRPRRDREEHVEQQIIVQEAVQVEVVVPLKSEVTKAEPKKAKKKVDVGAGGELTTYIYSGL